MQYQWLALFSVLCATAATVFAFDGGRWDLGLIVPPAAAATDLIRGAIFAAAIILVTDLLLALTTQMQVVRGSGFPWFGLAMVFLPAALHEELAFRGYIFQKIRQWNRPAAIAVTSIAFALLHLGNRGITSLAVVNLVLAGVLLALAYERSFRLWFPIGIHLAWNVLSGPVLGYEVSGYNAASTLLHTSVTGPAWLTGAAFGIEGSVWMGVVEVGGIWWLIRGFRRFKVQGSSESGKDKTFDLFP